MFRVWKGDNNHMKKVLLGLFVLSSIAVADIHKDRIDVYSAILDSINNQMVDLKMSFGEVRIGNIVRIYSVAGIKQIDTGYREFVLTDSEYDRVKELIKIRDEIADKIMVEYQLWDGCDDNDEIENDQDNFCDDCMLINK